MFVKRIYRQMQIKISNARTQGSNKYTKREIPFDARKMKVFYLCFSAIEYSHYPFDIEIQKGSL